jgi:hypothetical protein
MTQPLTEEECQAVVEACAAYPNGWSPHPEYLPLAERLRERGTFIRVIRAGKATYEPSPEFRAAAASNAAMFGAVLSMN